VIARTSPAISCSASARRVSWLRSDATVRQASPSSLTSTSAEEMLTAGDENARSTARVTKYSPPRSKTISGVSPSIRQNACCSRALTCPSVSTVRPSSPRLGGLT